ncbi:type IX secretion system protein PorQ [Salmonirosea aquatica]|uniref:type IX secretion system protein PorQ n=1 Tax=Salmonirosea aquatica TaxID=2654236 RepID=UPI0035710340
MLVWDRLVFSLYFYFSTNRQITGNLRNQYFYATTYRTGVPREPTFVPTAFAQHWIRAGRPAHRRESGSYFPTAPPTARLTALGARHVTLSGADATLFMQNPALLDTAKVDQLSMTYMPYLADTRFVSMAFAHEFGEMRGVWAGGIQYFNYGTMVETDDLGNPVGEFRAADYSLSVGYGNTIQNITIGGALKLVGSSLASYQLWGLALDWGAVFRHPTRDLTAGFVVKNLGFLKQNYAGGEVPPLPFDLRIGVTFKPEYAPLRLSLTAHHLNSFDMVYNDPALFYDFDANGNRIPRKTNLPEKFLRHLTLGTEILIHPTFRLMLGYDHLLRQELRLQDMGGFSGFSFGAWLRIKRFELAYGRAQYHAGMAANTFSFNLNLKK